MCIFFLHNLFSRNDLTVDERDENVEDVLRNHVTKVMVMQKQHGKGYLLPPSAVLYIGNVFFIIYFLLQIIFVFIL